MAEQCIVCLDTLGSISTENEPSPLKLFSDAVPVAAAAFGDDPRNTGKEQLIAVIQTCNHILHDVCLKAWIEKANSCPICRQTFHSVEVYDKIGGQSMVPPCRISGV